ncbi:hypothetical protein HK097_007549 [Rhizophlyctis rosea]|uniref:Myb-like domain-containing protein n=1 Tax=Rhizophlyctis rosea TaxID=64517 RepID=A0AAD5X4H2_9FUNG|nr:hypothetical protein HK097_007549 [Rhizophlyctis rosea]
MAQNKVEVDITKNEPKRKLKMGLVSIMSTTRSPAAEDDLPAAEPEINTPPASSSRPKRRRTTKSDTSAASPTPEEPTADASSSSTRQRKKAVPWSAEENAKLLTAIGASVSWPKVAKEVGTRDGSTCQMRWKTLVKKLDGA